MIQKTLQSFVYALRGLKTVWNEERNFRIEVFCAVVVALCIWFFSFSFVESMFCILAIIIVLSAEIINTSIEDLCNKVHPEYDPVIGKIKDTTSAFVLVSVVGAVIVGVLVFYNHFS